MQDFHNIANLKLNQTNQDQSNSITPVNNVLSRSINVLKTFSDHIPENL